MLNPLAFAVIKDFPTPACAQPPAIPVKLAAPQTPPEGCRNATCGRFIPLGPPPVMLTDAQAAVAMNLNQTPLTAPVKSKQVPDCAAVSGVAPIVLKASLAEQKSGVGI